MDYASLITQLQDWIPDNLTEAKLKEFISLAESKMELDLLEPGTPPRQMLARATGNTDASSQFTLPADFLQQKSVQVNGCPSKAVSSERVWDTGQGYGEAPVVLDYYQKIPALSDSNTTNWLIIAAPQMYLWCSMLHYAPYTQDSEIMQQWGSWYSDALTRARSVFKSHGAAPITRMRGPGWCSVYAIIGGVIKFDDYRH